MKIFISNTSNPLSGSLKHLIDKIDNGMQLVDNGKQSKVIISFAYHNEGDVVEMKTMGKMAFENPGKKIIFLSWFHPVDDFSRYSRLFSPERPTCILMDTARYRILQLPVTGKEIIECVSSLLNETDHE